MDNAGVAPKLLPFHLLQDITNGFSEDRKLGAGSYGKVYMGEYEDGETIAVKLLHYTPGLDVEQFEKEHRNLASLQHNNIVRLVGYDHETQRECVPYNGKMVFAEMTKRALCFEYMPNGSLDKFLSDESSGLDWCTRYAIIKGICEGIQYLHEELDFPMYHLDLKPANVLLDENMVPKIADFGLSRLFGGEQTQMTRSAIGTPGYVPPEYIDAAVISIKFDIFSLGVVIIKVMTGPAGYFRSAEMSPEQFIELVHENWKNRLQTTSLYESYSEQAKRCIEIALCFVDADRHKRPGIGVIINKLNETEDVIQLHEASTNDTGSYEENVTNWYADQEGHFKVISVVKFISRMNWFVVGNASGLIQVYSCNRALSRLNQFTAGGHGFVRSLAVHPSQPLVLSACGQLIKLWNWETDWECIRTFEAHSDEVKQAKFNPQGAGNTFASVAYDGAVKIWSIDFDTPISTLDCAWDRLLQTVDYFIPRGDRQYIVTGSIHGTAHVSPSSLYRNSCNASIVLLLSHKIWDLQSNTCIRQIKGLSRTIWQWQPSIAVVGCPGGHQILVTLSVDNAVSFCDSTTHRYEKKVHFSPNYFSDFGYIRGTKSLVIGYNNGFAIMETMK